MTKHTPGPWVIESQSVAGETFIVSGDEPLLSVAMTYDFGDGGKEGMANARLIAAAPDLLSALQAVMAEWREGYGLHCVEQVRAAIARATNQ